MSGVTPDDGTVSAEEAGSRPRRRRRRRRVLLAISIVLLAGIGVFIGLWLNTGAHEVTLSNAERQFQREEKGHDPPAHHERGRPAEGVYDYTGSGSEALSLPPKTQHEGPTIPGTVTYGSKGCWALRFDYSVNHWESATYCPHGTELLETRRGGWYQWDFVATTVGDAASYTCTPPEVAIPGRYDRNRRYAFSCLGKNHPLKLAPVTLSGWVEYLGSSDVVVGGTKVAALQIREIGRFSGGQSGTDVEDTFYDASTGLPLRGTWSTHVTTPTPIGNSTLTASGRFRLHSLVPHT